MVINSYNIFGITGGIGNSFYEIIKDNEHINICGFYYKNFQSALEIKNARESTTLYSVDLCCQKSIKDMIVPNYEGILYVAGKPHFSTDLLDFTEDQLQEQLNLNVYAILSIIKKALSYQHPKLKKIIIVTSIIPKEVNNIYHLFKKIQIVLVDTILHCLHSREIGFAIIESSWVDTKMYTEYLEKNNKKKNRVLSPLLVSTKCFDEFQNENKFNKIHLS